MKLPDFFQDEELNRLRQRMRAELIAWDSERDWDPISIVLDTEGLDVSPDDLEYPEDGTLEYRGRKVVVYIRDQIARFQPYKFHVANCSKLLEMREEGRYDRYVVATRTDGRFTVNTRYENGRIEEGAEHTLGVCIPCLKKLDYKNYNRCRSAEKAGIRSSFDLHEFFLNYNSQIAPTPIHTEATAPPNDYTIDWPEISLRLREQNNWSCERCGRDFIGPERQQLLHVHHVNGTRYDNRPENLRVLCSICHSLEPRHEHMRSGSN